VLYGTAPTFLALLLAVAVSFCVAAFLAGWLVARFLGAEPAEERSLMFGLGMNNNGTGMVLASAALGDHALVLLLIVCYNLVQHLVAGGVDYAFVRRPAPAPEADEAPLSWRQALRPVLSSSFILVTALVLANAGASYWNIRLMASNHRRVVRTQEVLRLLQGTLLLLRDAETVQRDYLLSGDARYLTAYQAAQDQVWQKLRQLARHTRDDPEQQERVRTLEGRVGERFAELGAMIALRRDHGLAAAGKAVLADRDKEGMGAVREVMDDIEEHEESRLEQRTAESDARVARALGTVVLMSVVLLVYTFVRRLGSVQKRARLLAGPQFVRVDGANGVATADRVAPPR
jgi:CHASE3 domain sensor protein